MRPDYRLTPEDEARVTERLLDVTAPWQGERNPFSADREALKRIAAHAIGLSLFDLRDCEVEVDQGPDRAGPGRGSLTRSS